MDPFNVTIIDDYDDAVDLLDYNLYKAGYHTKSFNNPIPALKYINPNNTQLVITDWLMPTMSGLELVKKLKSQDQTSCIPIIMVTCIDTENEIVTALKSGVDDYLTKPFKMNELIARVEKIKTKYEVAHPNTMRHGPLSLHTQNHCVHLNQKMLKLTFSEFRLIELFISHPHTVFSRNEILDRISGPDSISTERAVDVLIASTRKKLGNHKHLIETVRSVGYRLATSN